MSDDIRIPEPPPPGSQVRFGRLAAVDVRDRRFSMAAPATQRTFRNWLSPEPVWDQGETSQCVSYACNRFLVTRPIVNKPPLPLPEFYHEAQLVDEFEGENYDGTSIRAGFKVLQRLGCVSSYTWADEPQQVVRHILEIGPIVVGFDWTSDMMVPDADGYIWPTGHVLGGHAFLLLCANTLRKNPDDTVGAVRVLNSWGPSWGTKGRAWMTIGTLEKLMDGLTGWPGEAAEATEIKPTG